MGILLSKTVFIGLGGTGAKTLLRAKAAMMDNFGEIPPMIKFLAIDTDERLKVKYTDTDGNTFKLEEHEFMQFKVEDVPGYVKRNATACNFFPKELIKRKSSITEGAGQFRACGRLALIKNMSEENKASLRNAIDKVRLWQPDRNGKYEVDNSAPVRVFVVFSIAGGTGAGSFIDLPLILKSNNILEPGEKIAAIALLPEVYANKGFSAIHCKPNAIVGMTEYEFIADGVLEDMEPDAEAPSRRIKTPSGVTYQVEKDYLYDQFFLVNNRSSLGIQYQSDDEMADFISKALYLAAGFTGSVNNSSLDNITTNRNTVDGKECRYLGLGCAEIQIQPKQIADYYSLNYMQQLCSMLQVSKAITEVDKDVQSKIIEWQIEEDHDHDNIIDAIAPSRPKIGFANLSEFNEGANQEIKSKRNTAISAVRSNLSAHIYGNSGIEGSGALNVLKGNKLNTFHDYIKEKLNN